MTRPDHGHSGKQSCKWRAHICYCRSLPSIAGQSQVNGRLNAGSLAGHFHRLQVTSIDCRSLPSIAGQSQVNCRLNAGPLAGQWQVKCRATCRSLPSIAGHFHRLQVTSINCRAIAGQWQVKCRATCRSLPSIAGHFHQLQVNRRSMAG